MNSLRKWLYKPKKTDSSLLAQFYFADEDLNQVAAELDSFDGRKDPERCTMLVNQLRVCQDRVLNVIQKIMEEAISTQRANRDFRVKFPDDVLQDSLAGQLWFGAECLAAGSSILNREVESASMRPLARALTKNLDSLRSVLREQCLRSVTEYTDRIREALVIFDKLFAEFELSYVSAMVPVKTMKEYDMLQEVTVLFSETVQRALKLELLSQDMIDDYDPALMFTIPRLAIVCGLLIYPEGPLNPDMEPTNISEMYRPFQTLLIRIRELLYTLSSSELVLLERSLCSSEEPEMAGQQTAGSGSDEGQQQVDQGFHENGDGLPVAENLSPMSTGTGSPETPVNSVLGLLDLDTVSPSSTIVEGNFSFSPPDLQRTSSEELITNLNKSESQDSGLHSENVSTSDTVTVDCVQGMSQDIEGAATLLVVCSETPGVLGSPKDINITDSAGPVKSCECSLNRDSVSSVSSIQEGNSDKTNVNECDNVQSVNCNLVSPGQSPDNLCEAGHRTGCEESSDSWQLCCSIVNEVVEMVLDRHRGRQLADVHCCDSVSDCDTHCDSQPSEGDGVGDGLVEGVVNREDPLTRQYSWQYNVQFALPHISLADPEIDPERASSSSFSSNSTISDNNQPCDSMTEFVIETLAAMGRDTTSTVTTSTDCDSTRSSYSPSTSDTDGRAASSRSAASSNHQTASIPKTHSTNRNSAHPRSAQRSRSNVPSNMVDYLNNAIASGSNSDTKARLDAHPEARGRQDNCDSLEHIHCKTGSQRGGESQTQEDMTTQHGKNNLDSCGSSHSSCPSNASCTSSCSCDKDCCTESETSSCNSDGNDDEEVALAIQAAEMASRSEARSRFRSSNDLIHRLFVCIAGVADQLQTNYASDLRHILKCVFELNSTNLPDPDPEIEVGELAEVVNGPSDVGSGGNVEDRASTNTMPSPAQTGHTGHTGNTVHPNNAGHHRRRQPHTSRSILNEPPEWVPDEEVERCTACKTPFTFVRRRHHCRNCGKIFCGKCSSTTVPLPQYGHQKPVRVCHRCFLFQVSHFTIGE